MAEIRGFSIKEAISYGWDIVKKNFWFLFAILLISYGLSWGFAYIGGGFGLQKHGGEGSLGLILNLIGWVVGLELSLAKIVIFLKFADKKKPEVEDLFAYFKGGLLFRYFLISVIYGLMVIAGLILFIIPGIYLAVKYGFAPYVYADKQTSVWEAFEMSAEMTRGVKLKLLWFSFVQFLIVLAGALALGVGLIFAIPVTYMAEVHVYRKLSVRHHTA